MQCLPGFQSVDRFRPKQYGPCLRRGVPPLPPPPFFFFNADGMSVFLPAVKQSLFCRYRDAAVRVCGVASFSCCQIYEHCCCVVNSACAPTPFVHLQYLLSGFAEGRSRRTNRQPLRGGHGQKAGGQWFVWRTSRVACQSHALVVESGRGLFGAVDSCKRCGAHQRTGWGE